MSVDGMCRTCLLSGVVMFPLFDPNVDTAAVVELLTNLTGIPIAQNDGFPDRICMACIDEIRRTNAFKLKCESSHAFLIHLRNNVAIFNVTAGPETARAPSVVHQESICVKEEIIEASSDDLKSDDDSISDDHQAFFQEYFVIEELAEQNTLSKESDTSQLKKLSEQDSSHRNVKARTDVKVDTESSSIDEYMTKVETDTRPMNEYRTDPYQCAVCLIYFPSFGILNAHFVKDHPSERRCNICQRETTKSLWQHSLSHLPRLQECKECHKRFVQKKHLTEHTKIHERERRLMQCAGCNESLEAHCVRYKCEICSEMFTRKYFLKEHQMNAHNFVMPYKCPSCPTGFYRKFNLERHVKEVHQKKKD